MAYGIGVDTGGTYTDAVIVDMQTRRVLAKSKSPTTRQNLALGVGRALDGLPAKLRAQAEVVALSTTLATNACVEDKGGRARLVMLGTTRETLEWVGADRKYGLNYDDVLCLNTQGSFDGTVVEHPDWEKVMDEHDAFFRAAEALSIAELNAMHNGGVCEIVGRDALKSRYSTPLVMASELVSGLNVMERGATALLNARLLPVVDQFMKAVNRALNERGMGALRVVVRSDGSLMTDQLAAARPVETILSGPAASVVGCRALTQGTDALIVDMGGTTTDISILRGGAPQMTGGIRIGSWRTQIKGVFIDTFGLGGDTRVFLRDRQLCLDTRRVEPLCSAAARWPQIKDELASLLLQTRLHTRPLHEFLYLTHAPEHPERYTDSERALLDALTDGPKMIGGDALNLYHLDSERLEREGVVMRCGLTPTDAMHLRGDYEGFDAEASRLAARYFLRVLPQMQDTPEDLKALCDEIYGMVQKRLFENVVRVLMEATYPEICKGGLDDQVQKWISMQWDRRNEPHDDGFFRLRMDAGAALIGVGAPTHLFLPEVARALGAKCVIPEHSDVANAVGAVMADVTAQAQVEVRSGYGADGTFGYTIHAADAMERFEEYDQAVTAAKQAAKRLAEAEARRRGAMGELSVVVDVNARRTCDRSGAEVDLGTTVFARASGRIGEDA